jgi:hypothetical protein
MMVDDQGHFLPERSDDGTIKYLNGKPVVKQRLTASEAEFHSDAQQIFLDAYNKGSRRIEMLSGTERGLLASGQGVQTIRDAMLTEMNGGKVEYTSLKDANIDEYDDWIRAVRDEDFRRRLKPSTKKNMLELIQTAQHKGGLEPRIFNAMSKFANYLELDDSEHTSDPGVRASLEVETQIKIIRKRDHHTGDIIPVRVPQSTGATYVDPIDGEQYTVETVDQEAIRPTADNYKMETMK